MVYTYIVTLDAEWESHARTDVMFSPDKYILHIIVVVVVHIK